MITHPQPDILECEVKWVLESITMNKASESDGIPAELFQILKDDAVKVLHSVCQQIQKTQQWLSPSSTGLEEVSFNSNFKERQYQRMFKLPHNCTHLTHQQSNTQNSPGQASTVCGPRTFRCSRWIQKRKGRGTRDQIANIHWIIEKATDVQLPALCCRTSMYPGSSHCFLTAVSQSSLKNCLLVCSPLFTPNKTRISSCAFYKNQHVNP